MTQPPHPDLVTRLLDYRRRALAGEDLSEDELREAFRLKTAVFSAAALARSSKKEARASKKSPEEVMADLDNLLKG